MPSLTYCLFFSLSIRWFLLSKNAWKSLTQTCKPFQRVGRLLTLKSMLCLLTWFFLHDNISVAQKNNCCTIQNSSFTGSNTLILIETDTKIYTIVYRNWTLNLAGKINTIEHVDHCRHLLDEHLVCYTEYCLAKQIEH